jgi:hypothetical protein
MENGGRIGRYELLDKLGEGGMAEVWKARNLSLDHVVAMKFLLAQFTLDADLQARFLEEGRIQARLRHPNIVAAFDGASENGRSYLVMDYVDGETLEVRIARNGGRPLPVDAALGISRDVLAALQYAHTLPQGPVVHRDVKPSNILLGRDEHSRLADFGIAVVLSEDRRTKTGLAPGSAFYMSPEQIQTPRLVDARSDLYSFGCVLYEMLAGRPPFGGESDSDFTIKAAHVHQLPPPLRPLNPSLPPEYEWVVLRALSKDRAQRFQSAAAMADALATPLKTMNAHQRAAQEAAALMVQPAKESLASGAAAVSGASALAKPAAGAGTAPGMRICPYCGAPTPTAICAGCSRDTTAPRKICSDCGKMMPAADRQCWFCGTRAHSELRWKIPLMIGIILLLLVLQIIFR